MRYWNFGDWIGAILSLTFVLFVIFLFVGFIWNGVVACNSKYWITQYRKTVYVDDYGEEDGCVFFYDNWLKGDGKICGEYIIREIN